MHKHVCERFFFFHIKARLNTHPREEAGQVEVSWSCTVFYWMVWIVFMQCDEKCLLLFGLLIQWGVWLIVDWRK